MNSLFFPIFASALWSHYPYNYCSAHQLVLNAGSSILTMEKRQKYISKAHIPFCIFISVFLFIFIFLLVYFNVPKLHSLIKRKYIQIQNCTLNRVWSMLSVDLKMGEKRLRLLRRREKKHAYINAREWERREKLLLFFHATITACKINWARYFDPWSFCTIITFNFYDMKLVFGLKYVFD